MKFDHTRLEAVRPAEDEMNHYERELDKVYQEFLDSTQRSVQQLEHSGQLGINTANELLNQREKLERTENNLDEIHRTTFETQRNLNSIKSFFSGFFKNKFSRDPKELSADIPPSKCDNKFKSHLNSSSSSSSASAIESTSLSDLIHGKQFKKSVMKQWIIKLIKI